MPFLVHHLDPQLATGLPKMLSSFANHGGHGGYDYGGGGYDQGYDGYGYDNYGGYGNEGDYGYDGYGYDGYGYDDGYGGYSDPYAEGAQGPEEEYAGGEYPDETEKMSAMTAPAPAQMQEEAGTSSDYGVIDPRLGKGKDPALGPDIVDGLREVHDKIKDVREALNIYRIVKADGSRAMQQLERMPRQMPGGVPWASALDLEHVVEKTKYIPAADFDNLINGMHEMQVSLDGTLRNYLMKKAAAHESARESMAEAAQAAREAADLIRGANPDAVPPPEVEPAPPEEELPEMNDSMDGAVGPAEAEELSEELGFEVPPDAKLEDLPDLNDIAELNNEGVDLEQEREQLYAANINDELSKVSCAPPIEMMMWLQAPVSTTRRHEHRRFLINIH